MEKGFVGARLHMLPALLAHIVRPVYIVEFYMAPDGIRAFVIAVEGEITYCFL